MEASRRVLRGAAVLLLGLMAGFFFAFSDPVMPGLARAPGPVFATAMARINEEVRNLAFLAAFAGPLPLLAAAAAASPGRRVAWGLALALYVAAVAVTGTVNVPINEAIALWRPDALPADWDALRDRWAAANHVRAALTLAAFALALGCVAAPCRPLSRG